MKLIPLASKIDVMSPDFSGSGDVVRPDEGFDRMLSALPSEDVSRDPGKNIERDQGNVSDAVEQTASISPELRLLGQILLQTPVPQEGAQSTGATPLYPNTIEVTDHRDRISIWRAIPHCGRSPKCRLSPQAHP